MCDLDYKLMYIHKQSLALALSPRACASFFFLLLLFHEVFLCVTCHLSMTLGSHVQCNLSIIFVVLVKAVEEFVVLFSCPTYLVVKTLAVFPFWYNSFPVCGIRIESSATLAGIQVQRVG